MREPNFSLLPIVFHRHRVPAIATFLSVLGGAIAYLIFTPRLYEARVRLMLDNNQASVSELGRNLSAQSNIAGSNPIAIQAELARSQSVLESAITQLSSETKKSPNLAKLTPNQLKTKLKTTIIPATNLLELSYRHKNPVLSAKILNAVTNAMMVENGAAIRSEASSTRKFLEAEVPKKRAELVQAEAALSDYKRSQKLVSLADVNGQDNTQTRNLITSLTTLEDEERKLSAGLEESKQRNQSLKQVTDNTSLKETYAAVRSGQAQELKNLRDRLVNLESEIAVARSRLTDTNPVVLNLLENREAIRSLYKEKSGVEPNIKLSANSSKSASDQFSQDLASKVILGQIEISSIEKKLGAIRAQKAKLQASLDQLPIKEQALAGIMRQRQEAAVSLEFLQRKLEEARIAEAQQVRNLRVIDSAEPPAAASWPKVPIVMSIAGASGLILSVGMVLLLELLNDRLSNATEAEALVNLSVLGVLPILPPSFQGRPEAFLTDITTLESYRTLLTALKFRSPNDLKTLVVSSTLAEEGKSTLVSHLAAISATLAKKTLIIDADLRRPKQHKLFNLQAQPGLTNVIKGEIALAEAVQHTKIDNLSVLTCGESQLHPSQFFESPRMHTLLAEAAKEYDFVILDTPPVTSCVDAVTLSRDSDGLLMVARPNFTQKDVFVRAVSELNKNRINILGVAINGTDTRTERFYHYGMYEYKAVTGSN
ncbi:MAG: polysaccharide biosynthesis tyrosine autokinase [Pleurocapsa minor HA4230-MV1]|nr:polysaccharide biosynthesis tyrosine autokinase [Pleurocapsa minor HA4230-MV1]